MKEIRRHIDPDFLFIEPSEMAVTQELRNVAAQGRRDMRYETGPVITLLDGPLFGFHWQERRPLLLGQISDADMVAVSRADEIGEKEHAAIFDTLRHCAAEPFLLSIRDKTGLEKIMSELSN